MKITEGREMMEILNDFKTFISRIGIIPGHINNFFPAFRDVQFYESFSSKIVLNSDTFSLNFFYQQNSHTVVGDYINIMKTTFLFLFKL